MKLWPQPEPEGRGEIIEHLRTDHALWPNEMNYGSFEGISDRALALSHAEDHAEFKGQNDHVHRRHWLAMFALAFASATAALGLVVGAIYAGIWIAS